MYAVIETGGKQYRVAPGDIVQIEKLDGEKGTNVKFDRVLFVAEPKDATASQTWIGKPLLSGATVSGEIVGQGRGDKIHIFKFRRRKKIRKRQGHRQFQTQVLITALTNGAGGNATLEAAKKTAILGKFHTQLRARGEAFTPKTLGSRERALKTLNAQYGDKSSTTSATTETKSAKPAVAKKTAVKPKAPAKKGK